MKTPANNQGKEIRLSLQEYGCQIMFELVLKQPEYSLNILKDFKTMELAYFSFTIHLYILCLWMVIFWKAGHPCSLGLQDSGNCDQLLDLSVSFVNVSIVLWLFDFLAIVSVSSCQILLTLLGNLTEKTAWNWVCLPDWNMGGTVPPVCSQWTTIGNEKQWAQGTNHNNQPNPNCTTSKGIAGFSSPGPSIHSSSPGFWY